MLEGDSLPPLLLKESSPCFNLPVSIENIRDMGSGIHYKLRVRSMKL